MLEHHANQASGLLGLGCHSGPRMLAVVSHGDEQAELPLLWQLCLALVTYGYAVTVLDANTYESDSNPGLLELLENAQRPDNANRNTPAWLVLPSGRGIQSLCSPQSLRPHSLQQLGQLFPQEGVLILYCKVEWMTPLVAGSDIEPLLAVSHSRSSLVTSYQALKRLLINGKLRPTIVNMIQDPTPNSSVHEHHTVASLSECAKRFLGEDVRALDIVEQLNEENQQEDIQRLALRLIEKSIPLSKVDTPFRVLTQASHFGQVDRFAGSH